MSRGKATGRAHIVAAAALVLGLVTFEAGPAGADPKLSANIEAITAGLPAGPDSRRNCSVTDRSPA